MSRIQTLLNKFAAGNCTPEEFDELMLLLQHESNDSEIRSTLKSIYESLDKEVLSDMQVDNQGAIVELEKAIGYPASNKNGLGRKLSLVLGCLFAAGLMGYFLFRERLPKGQDHAKMTQISTQQEAKTNLILPDGTKVWLNSYSTITYHADFEKGKREVTLVGEALFDVKHDSLHPFIVHTRNFDVTDLGTVFNVSAYPEDATATTSLISGLLEVSLRDSQKEKIMLVPNQRITVRNSVGDNAGAQHKELLVKTSIITDSQTKMLPDTAWMARKLMFRDISFYDLALQMQRRYHAKIIFNDASAGEYKFTGKFDDETLEEALTELQAIAPFTYRREKDHVYIER